MKITANMMEMFNILEENGYEVETIMDSLIVIRKDGTVIFTYEY